MCSSRRPLAALALRSALPLLALACASRYEQTPVGGCSPPPHPAAVRPDSGVRAGPGVLAVRLATDGGGPLGVATAELLDAGAGTSRRAPLDSLGRLRVTGAPAAEYVVRARLMGYAPRVDTLRVPAGDDGLAVVLPLEPPRCWDAVALRRKPWWEVW